MRRGVALWTGCAILLAGAAVANARGAHDLSDEELRSEMVRNRAMAAYVARNGEPDVAEAHFLADTPPWDDHEVTLYYLDMRKEIGFARAWILGRPDIHLERYERPLSDEHIAALSSRSRRHVEEAPRMSAPEQIDDTPRVTPAAAHVVEEVSPSPMGPDERAEEAARRAEEAAGRVELAADTAERAADRAEAVTIGMEREFHSSLRK